MEDKHLRGGRFVLVCVSGFLFLGIFNIMHHVMWRDELEAWMMARDASTLGELFNNIRYQGHPALWFLTLYALSAITPNPLIMQIAHLAIAVGVVYVAVRSAPFTELQKVLFILGYYPFYEYCVISRNYSYGLLLLFIFLSLFRPGIKDKNYIYLSIVLFFLCQSNPYGAVIAIALFLMLIFELIFSRDKAATISSKEKWALAAGIVIFTCGLLISAIQMHPPHDSFFYHPPGDMRLTLNNFFGSIACVWSACIPIPMVTMQFWGSNVITYIITDPVREAAVRFFLSMAIVTISSIVLLRRPVALFYYAVGTFGIILFNYMIYAGAIRHIGHYFIVLVSAFWLSNLYDEKSSETGVLNQRYELFEAAKNVFFTVVLVSNVIAGVAANTLGHLYPFSANKETATYIKTNGLDKMPILGDPDCVASGVAAYLNRPIYYPATQRHATFVTWDNKRQRYGPRTILAAAEQYALNKKKDILLVLNYPIDPDSLARYGGNVYFVKAFAGSVLIDEKFCLYIMKYAHH
ncbi:hypothetical protein [Candidatus Magnetominusculus dajiuhuensis]|uniref:hypothetical protein n=1 Tax=Candidatus Magnetominusculus dajiuhuensis TaxID=3137712 RepID=UPI003B4395A2